MEKTQGIIKAVKVRDKGYSIMINSDWFSGFGKLSFNKNDEVDIDWSFSDDGKWKNISNIKLISKGEPFKEAREEKAHLMILSYCKDQVVACIARKEELDINALWELAYKNVTEAYKKLKEEFK